MNQMNNNKNKGFSLVELIVVIAIMAVMVAVLAPSLLQYVERSRAQKDDSAMGEVANAVMLGLSDQKIYDEVLYSTAKGNVSCYIDKNTAPAAAYTGATANAIKTKDKTSETGDEDQYIYNDDQRLADEIEYYFAGNMRGMTITFSPTTSGGNSSVFDIGQGIINAGLKEGARVAQNNAQSLPKYYGDGSYTGKTLAQLEAAAYAAANDAPNGHHYLYNRVRATVGDEIVLTSQTYRRSSYTVFIRMGSTGGNSAAGQDSVKVYGQWNGTNLS